MTCDGWICVALTCGVVDVGSKKSWADAVRAPEGREAENWPDEWKVGLVVPLWKHKGSREDKNTWRGVMARLVANRLARWVDPWLPPGFVARRCGRSWVDGDVRRA